MVVFQYFMFLPQDFARDLEEAILLAGCGKWKRLREVLENPDQAEEVLQICRLLDDEAENQNISNSVEQEVMNMILIKGMFLMLHILVMGPAVKHY